MKKLSLIFCVLFTISVFSGCGYSKSDLESARQEGYKLGYSDGYDYGYDKGLSDGYDYGYEDGYYTLEPISMPPNGTVLSGTRVGPSDLTVTADDINSYVVSVRNVRNEEICAFFVRAGHSATVSVPDDYLSIYFASGTTWYGYGEGRMFGKDTVYSKDDELLNCIDQSWEYTMYPVSDGNFSETPCDSSEFWG